MFTPMRVAAGLAVVVVLIAYVGRRGPGAVGGVRPPGPVDGAEVYQRACANCHFSHGQGAPGQYIPLAGSRLLMEETELAIAVTLHGMKGRYLMNGSVYNGEMGPWGTLSDEEIAAVLTWARNSWGNAGPAVSVAEVQEVRARLAGRESPWTWPELESLRSQSARDTLDGARPAP